ncbi:MAG: co-chaperone GroES [Candidatus Kapaibacterium sp.]
MNLTPLHDRIIVKAATPEETTKGGIIIPETAKEKPMQGEVIAVGKGRITEDGKTIELQLNKGDKVLYGKYSGTEITIEGNEYLIMRESDVLAVIS